MYLDTLGSVDFTWCVARLTQCVAAFACQYEKRDRGSVEIFGAAQTLHQNGAVQGGAA